MEVQVTIGYNWPLIFLALGIGTEVALNIWDRYKLRIAKKEKEKQE
jgi:hypothetical protein